MTSGPRPRHGIPGPRSMERTGVTTPNRDLRRRANARRNDAASRPVSSASSDLANPAENREARIEFQFGVRQRPVQPIGSRPQVVEVVSAASRSRQRVSTAS